MKKRSCIKRVFQTLVAFAESRNMTDFVRKGNLDYRSGKKAVSELLEWGLISKDDNFYKLTQDGIIVKGVLDRNA